MSTKKLVIVESPMKAKTIKKFLGSSYQVDSCMGHIRDLPQSTKEIPEKYKKKEWASLGVNVKDDFAPIYCTPSSKSKVIKQLKEKLKDSSELILATDEDREGESISWHLVEVLKPKVPIKRIVFHEITEKAIKQALSDYRKIDLNLVKAQEARRILDRLVGYSLSPLLWKKICYGLSAGRVQSAALKLIIEKELERMKFKASSYKSLEVLFKKSELYTQLLSYKDKKLASGKDFDPDTGKIKNKNLILDEKTAKSIKGEIEKAKKLKVSSTSEKEFLTHPQAPFITSSLQQTAIRMFGFSAKKTMQLAQKLYEEGLITYMRTDSYFLSTEAIKASRTYIEKQFGKKYLSQKVLSYTSKKSKSAQEAHEAIRPAGVSFKDPAKTSLKGDLFKLYHLIWARTLSSQMSPCVKKQLKVEFKLKDLLFVSSGVEVIFDGCEKLLKKMDSSKNPLSLLKKNQEMEIKDVEIKDHKTKAPARYSEAGLIQVMEKEGIGRPSTYASIIHTIEQRGYVFKKDSRLLPSLTAFMVTRFLDKYLHDYVDLKFTSKMEESLDQIAEGKLDYLKYLDEIYFGKKGLKKQVDLNDKEADANWARSFNLDHLKKFTFKVGRYGAYVCRMNGKTEECASIPENNSLADLSEDKIHELIDQKISGGDQLGICPETKKEVSLLTGRYGPYVQLGSEKKSKKVSIPPKYDAKDIDLKKALFLLSFPRVMGTHPKTKKEIKLGIGRFGAYLLHDSQFSSVPRAKDLFELNLSESIEIVDRPKKSKKTKKELKDLGEHPKTKKSIKILDGVYGAYIRYGTKNVSIGDKDPKKLDLKEALKIIDSSPKKTKKSPSVKKKQAIKPGVKVIRRKRAGA